MTQAIPELRDPTPDEQPRRAAAASVRVPTAVPVPAKPAAIPIAAPAASEPAAPASVQDNPPVLQQGSKVDWEAIPMEDGLQRLADLRAESDKGGLIMQRRMDEERVETRLCYNPSCKNGQDGGRKLIVVGTGNFAGAKHRQNYETGKVETEYACSAACFMYLTNNFRPKVPQPR